MSDLSSSPGVVRIRRYLNLAGALADNAYDLKERSRAVTEAAGMLSSVRRA